MSMLGCYGCSGLSGFSYAEVAYLVMWASAIGEFFSFKRPGSSELRASVIPGIISETRGLKGFA